MTPLVSINCLVYNHEPYLRDCFDGFVMQETNFSFEILVHDDASTDCSADIIREYTAKYPELFKPIFQTENQYSKGKGFIGLDINNKRAKGMYIALCEGDDYWIDPLKLQKQVDFLEANPEYVLSHTNFKLYYEEVATYISFRNSFQRNDIKPESVLKDYRIQTMTVVFKKVDYENVINSDINLYISSYYLMRDTQLWFGLMLKGKVHYLNDETAVYRKRVNSATTQKNIIRNLRFTLSSFEMRKYIVLHYNLSSDIKRWINENYNKTLLQYLSVDPYFKPLYEYDSHAIKSKILWICYKAYLIKSYLYIVFEMKRLHKFVRYTFFTKKI